MPNRASKDLPSLALDISHDEAALVRSPSLKPCLAQMNEVLILQHEVDKFWILTEFN